MSDPSVDPEKGITGLKEEEKGITGLKEEEEKAAHHQFKHLKDMCVMRLMDVYPVLFFVTTMFGAVVFYKQTHYWLPLVVASSISILTFWKCSRLKKAYIQHNTLASASGDLSTALLAPSKK